MKKLCTAIISTLSSKCSGLTYGGGGPIHFMALQFLICLLAVATEAYELKPTTTISKATLAGRTAELPCELPAPLDKPTLILWYKDQSTKPFYSYDARKTEGRHKIHDKSDLATRSKFRLETIPNVHKRRLGYLVVENISLSDAGNYTCRVDFMTSQTMMSLLQLTVHENIRDLEVVDVKLNKVTRVAGPYKEKSSITLYCRALGGYPKPVVQWMSGDEILDPSPIPSTRANPKELEEGGESAMLHLPRLQRTDDGREIKCIAFNSNLTQPLSRVLSISVFLSPTAVKLEGLSQPLLAGVEASLLCRSFGSKPVANLNMKLAGANGLTQLSQQLSLDQNTTTRRGRIIPTPEDNGRDVTCIATNPKVPEFKREISRKLEVHYAPEVEVKLAPALNPKNIKEGEDVYFECIINANPLESKVLWLHEGVQLNTSKDKGILAQGKNLVLQKVRRQSRGKYQCRVTNPIDTVTSAATNLDVMFAPECSGPRNRTVSVIPIEDVKLQCLIEANPEQVSFVWKVNSTRGLQELDLSAFTSQGRSSTLTFRPSAYSANNDDYGVVFCHGVNKIGTQTEPCVFVISPAGPPEVPKSCILRNQSATSLAVVCKAGHDGGLQQHFIATVQNAENGGMVANMSSPRPNFSVGGLTPGTDYLVSVKAVNAKGASQPYVLEGLALKVAENKINDSSSTASYPPLLVFGSVFSGFSLIVVVIVIANRARRWRRRSPSDTGNEDKVTPEEEAPDIIATKAPTEEAEPKQPDKAEGVTEVAISPDTQSLSPLLQATQTQSSSPLIQATQTQSMDSSSSLTCRGYVPYTVAGQSRSLPRLHNLHPQPQPLQSVDLPHMSSTHNKYYTLKINCTRQNNESFV